VYVEESEAGSRPIEGVGTAVAAFVGFAAAGPVNSPTLVTNWSQFTQTFGEFVEGSYLAHAVYGYFMNGGGSCYVVRIGANGSTDDGKGKPGKPQARAELAPAGSGAQGTVGGYRVTALQAGPAGNDLTIEVADATQAGAPAAGDGPPEELFKLVVKRGGKSVEEFDAVTTKRGKQNVVTVVNAQSKLIHLEETAAGGALEKPAKGSVALSGGDLPSPATVAPDDYIGDASERTGFGGLEAVDPVTMLAAPDLMAAYQQGMLDLEGLQAVQQAMLAHCELMGDRVAILDPPPGLNPQQIREWRVNQAAYDSKYAALYYPWIKVFDPATARTMFVPPSGHIAGIWGRNDDTRGVHKAPANEVIRGAVALEVQLTKQENELLNPQGINCLRAFPGRGLRVWGARTLSSDPAWRYINIRRLFNYLEESILAGMQWAVFEPNDPALWGRMRRSISAFLVNEWRKGALFGATPEQAFYVKCDDETNPAEQIDAGMVVCEVGVAPVKPAEFVVFRLSQFSGGLSTVAE
jgi:hypothetical protein